MRQTFAFGYLGLLMMTAANLAAAQTKEKISGNVVKIAVLTDMSGPYSDIGGRGTVVAAQMADVITEVQGSAVALAVAKVTTEKNKIMLTTGAATTRLTNEDCAPGNVVQWVYDTYALAIAGKAVTKSANDTWFFLTADYAGGHDLEKDTISAIKASGGTVIGTVRHPFSSPDLSSFLLQAQSSKAKFVGLANAGGDLINSIKGAREYKLTDKQAIVGLFTNINDIHSLGLQTTQGMLFVEGFYWNLSKETREWSRRFFADQKKMPNSLQAGNYSAVSHYLKAVAEAGTDDTAKVMAQMKREKVNDIFTHDGFIREDGRMVHDMYLVEVKKPGESTEPWDYYRVKQVIPGAEAFQPLSVSRCPVIKK